MDKVWLSQKYQTIYHFRAKYRTFIYIFHFYDSITSKEVPKNCETVNNN